MKRLALALVLAGSAAAAEPLRDLASGISITAPAGYVATPAAPVEPGNTRPIFDIRRPGETDTGCRVSTVDAPVNAFLSQAELNDRAASPEFQHQMASSLAQIYDLVAVDVVTSGRVTGFAAIGDTAQPLSREAPQPRVRALLVFLDTPLMRVFFACVAEPADFMARLSEFERVLDGLVIP
jgi:hypothetical protein